MPTQGFQSFMVERFLCHQFTISFDTRMWPSKRILHYFVDGKIRFLCRVEEFDSEAMRVSLTLEQYIIPELLAWGVPSFEIKRLRY